MWRLRILLHLVPDKLWVKITLAFLIGARAFSLSMASRNIAWEKYVAKGTFWGTLRDNRELLQMLYSSGDISISDLTEREIVRFDRTVIALVYMDSFLYKNNALWIRRLWNFTSTSDQVWLLLEDNIFEGILPLSGTLFSNDYLLDYVNDPLVQFNRGSRVKARSRIHSLYLTKP